MERLPIFLNIRDRRCLLVGGGEIAARKARLLIRCGAELLVVAPTICEEIKALSTLNGSGKVTLQAVDFSADHLHDACIVVAATDDQSINRKVSELAQANGLPVNVVDQPELCSFILPAIVDRSPILVAISSGGSSPVLGRKLKELSEIMLPGKVGTLAELLSSFRPEVKASISGFDQRVRFWEDVLDSEIPELVYSDNYSRAKNILQQKLDKAGSEPEPTFGEVYLVGAGPGDPELLTLKALRLMHKADVILYDRLVSEEIMDKCRPDAEKMYVGKARADHAVEQQSINQLLVNFAQQGKRVLRLKGGDPFIFGRGGEELSTLAEAGVNFQIVPGITAASGCASYAGIPLTHRDYSQSVRFLTGHTKDGRVPLDWKTLVKEQQTLVFYMGLVGLPLICEQLIEHGKSASTPVAVIQQGTTVTQKVASSTLENIVSKVVAAELKAPTIIIVGEVVSLRKNLEWFGYDR
jgi:uroporphyrin-III C-methyltransferase / precorrin-2 dehydrogenase / sirohydrochlorin ferrochelatase